MNRIHEFLKPFETKLVLAIHDEAVLEGPAKEAPVVIPSVKSIMETAYPYKYVQLTCDVEHSTKSLADKVKGIVTETGNQVCQSSASKARAAFVIGQSRVRRAHDAW